MFVEKKSLLLESISTLHNDILRLKELKEVSNDENERYRSQMIQ